MQRSGMAPEKLVWARDVIDRQTTHLARLVDDLLDVSRLIQNKINLQLERLLIAQMVDWAIESA